MMARKMVWAALSVLVASVWGYPLSLCDYRVPETSLLDMDLSLTYHYRDDPSQPGVEINLGKATFTYTQLYNAPSQGFSIDAKAVLGARGFELVDALLESSATYRFYFATEEPFFFFGGAEGSWRPTYVNPWFQVTLGLGYGRFNDVTPLAKAMLISEDLLRIGAIPASLSEDALLAVAQEIGRRAEYERLEDLVAKVEEIIETDTGVDLDARAVLRIEERITETGRERYCGGAIQAGLGYELLNPRGGDREVVLSASANWALAPEPRSQLLLRGDLSAPMPWANAYTARLGFTYDYELNGRTSFRADYSLEWVKEAEVERSYDSHDAVFQLNLNLGGWKIAFTLSFSKGPGDVAWTQEFVISAAIDLR